MKEFFKSKLSRIVLVAAIIFLAALGCASVIWLNHTRVPAAIPNDSCQVGDDSCVGQGDGRPCWREPGCDEHGNKIQSCVGCGFGQCLKEKCVDYYGPMNNSTIGKTEIKATSSGEIISELMLGQDYKLDFPEGYFIEEPQVFEVTCDLAKECPCIYQTPESIYNQPNEDRETFCKNVAPERKGDFCVQEWSGAAAGSLYTTSIYTKAVRGFTDRCASLRFTKQYISDCGVFGGEGAAEASAQCEKDKSEALAIINGIVSSFNPISPRY